jgi:predicted HD phosphohydrolase
MSNLRVFPGKFVACFAIALGKLHRYFLSVRNGLVLTRVVGDRFTSRVDQEYLRDLWYACERSHGFPPTSMIHQLEQSWGWSESS